MPHPPASLQEYLQTQKYPVIKIPQRILDILSDEVPQLKHPYEYPKPEAPSLKAIHKPVKPEQGVIAKFLGFNSSFNRQMAQYEFSIRNYYINQNNAQEQYNAELETYEKEMSFYKEMMSYYKRKMIIYNETIKHVSKGPLDSQTRKALLNIFLKNSAQPTFWQNNSSLATGLSESLFKDYLRSNCVLKLAPPNSTIVENNELDPTSVLYSPDFVLTSNDRLLVIGIEIDEPYVASSGKPIHYVITKEEAKRRHYPYALYGSSDKKSRWSEYKYELISIDDIKDGFFIRNGWTIVRFTEKQVIESPIACVNLINELASYLQLTDLNSTKTNQKIKTEERWSEYLAKYWAKDNYRESYLPAHLIDSLRRAKNNYRSSASSSSSQDHSSSDGNSDNYDDLPF